MRLTLATDTFLPEVNGVTTVLAAMRQGLLAHGHAVQLLAPAYPELGDDEDGVHRVPSVPCPYYPAVRLSWPWGRRLGTAVERFAPDLVHVATEGPIGLFGRAHALRTGRPLITSFHTDFPHYAGAYLGRWAVQPTRRYLRWFHHPARVTQTPSAVACRKLRELGLVRAVVWGRVVDCGGFTPARRDEARRQALGARGKVMVLHVGRLAVEKDTETLVAAFRSAHAHVGHAALFCVAGDGPEAERVRGELPFARHLGFLARDRLADLYADADLFVFPSPSETCGLVALEAMASELPVIGADQGGIRDSVRHDRTGLLVRPGDPAAFAEAIAALVKDGPRRRAMGRAAREYALRRDWSRELGLLVEQYGAVLDGWHLAVAPIAHHHEEVTSDRGGRHPEGGRDEWAERISRSSSS
jgi:glycosyltransferase involved in cell wall biosynthesis